MKIVITGGTGQIGSRLVQSLAQAGHEVIVLTRSPEQHQTNMPAGIRLIEWDGRTSDGWLEHADGADVLVNFAGRNLDGGSFIPKRWTTAAKQEILNSRVNAGKAVIEAIRKAEVKPKLLIQASASGYYGTNLDQEKKSETDSAGDDWLAGVCQQWESATEEVEAMGVRRIIVRTGLILDDDGGVLPRFVLPFRMFVGGKMGSGRQYYPWIHIKDEVRALRFLMEQSDLSGPYNLSAPEPVTNQAMADAIGRTLQRPSWFPLPAFMLKLGLGEVASLALGGQRMIPTKLQQAGFNFKHPTLAAALQDLLG